MGQPQLKLPDCITVEDFFGMTWPDDRRRQLIDGQIVSMTAPMRAHLSLVTTLSHAIGRVLADCCEVLTDAALIPTARQHTCYEVDLLVTCEPAEPRQRTIRAPVLIAEVLSPSTRSIDRTRKLPDYRKLPSVQEILPIDSEQMAVEVYRRFEGDRWLSEVFNEPGDVLRLTSVNLEITLADLYRRVVFAADDIAV